MMDKVLEFFNELHQSYEDFMSRRFPELSLERRLGGYQDVAVDVGWCAWVQSKSSERLWEHAVDVEYERQRFEVWARRQNNEDRLKRCEEDGGYEDISIDYAWNGWIAGVCCAKGVDE